MRELQKMSARRTFFHVLGRIAQGNQLECCDSRSLIHLQPSLLDLLFGKTCDIGKNRVDEVCHAGVGGDLCHSLWIAYKKEVARVRGDAMNPLRRRQGALKRKSRASPILTISLD